MVAASLVELATEGAFPGINSRFTRLHELANIVYVFQSGIWAANIFVPWTSL
jgi:hypothetical protein